MQILAIGGTTSGSKISAINRNAQWSGTYLAAGVNCITMSLKNTDSNNLQVRVVIASVAAGTTRPQHIAVSTRALSLPVGGGWVTAVFPIGPGFLTGTGAEGNVLKALTNAGELRVIHNPAATFPPPTIIGRLAVDNIKAERRSGLPYLPLLLLDD